MWEGLLAAATWLAMRRPCSRLGSGYTRTRSSVDTSSRAFRLCSLPRPAPPRPAPPPASHPCRVPLRSLPGRTQPRQGVLRHTKCWAPTPRPSSGQMASASLARRLQADRSTLPLPCPCAVAGERCQRRRGARAHLRFAPRPLCCVTMERDTCYAHQSPPALALHVPLAELETLLVLPQRLHPLHQHILHAPYNHNRYAATTLAATTLSLSAPATDIIAAQPRVPAPAAIGARLPAFAIAARLATAPMVCRESLALAPGRAAL